MHDACMNKGPARTMDCLCRWAGQMQRAERTEAESASGTRAGNGKAGVPPEARPCPKARLPAGVTCQSVPLPCPGAHGQ